MEKGSVPTPLWQLLGLSPAAVYLVCRMALGPTRIDVNVSEHQTDFNLSSWHLFPEIHQITSL